MLYNEGTKDMDLVEKIKNRIARIGVIILSYVGLPFETAIRKTSFFVTGLILTLGK